MENAARPQAEVSQGKSYRQSASCFQYLWEPVSIVGKRRLPGRDRGRETGWYSQRIRCLENKIIPMFEMKIVKNERDYRQALGAIEMLMANDPDSESAEGEQLELLSTLVADFESKFFPSTLPDPIEAIKFRMEQADLKPTDLVP